jgi:hypothetical protein
MLDGAALIRKVNESNEAAEDQGLRAHKLTRHRNGGCAVA